VIESHSGKLTLLDRAPRGIVAKVTLPRAVAAVGADGVAVMST
jgi:hypothetical protein